MPRAEAAAAPDPNPPSGFAVETVLGGHGELDTPIAVEFFDDGRILVAEKRGVVKLFDGFDDPTATTFADLRTDTYTFGDRGLLGLAIDPQFASGRPYVYALISYDAPPGETAPYWNDACPDPPGPNTHGCVTTARLLKFTVSGDLPTGPPEVLVEDWCNQFTSHSIGDVAIGPDGYLYVSAGDGANFDAADWGQFGYPSDNPCNDPPGGHNLYPPAAEGGALRSQDALTSADPQSLDGAILRLDPDTGAAAPGNPYAASADANRRRLIAFGMRNPFRFAFRPGTDELWVGEVGWGDHEEIDRVADVNDTTIENFGWPCYEGPARQSGYDAADLALCENLYTAATASAPRLSYAHADAVVPGDSCPTGGSSVTGVAFYDGGDYPAAFDGAMFFADFTRQCVWVVYPGAGGAPDWDTRQLLLQHDRWVVELTRGPGGDIYMVDANGGIERIHYYPGNRPPNARITSTTPSGTIPLTVTFDAGQSTDPDVGDSITAFAWDLDGDGQFDDSTAAVPSHVYDSPGAVTVRLRVTDEQGATDTDTIAVSPAESPPIPYLLGPAYHLDGATLLADDPFTVADEITFSGLALDAQDGVLPASGIDWELRQRHCDAQGQCHTHFLQTWEGTTTGSFDAPDHEYPSYLELYMTATDSAGLATTHRLQLEPATATLRVESDPAGLDVAVDAQTGVTPFERTVIAGSQHTISAVSPLARFGNHWTFATWTDGGAKDHTINVPGAGRSIEATYSDAPVPGDYDYRITLDNGRTDRFARGSHTTVASASSSAPVVVDAASTPSRSGFWRVTSAGKIATRGDAQRFGSLAAAQRTAAAVGIEATTTGNGYWIALADGSVHAFGDAGDLGDASTLTLRAPIVGIARTPTGEGFWLADSQGGIYPFGDARWRGSLRGSTVRGPVIAIGAAPGGAGYWLATSGGDVAAFGSADAFGELPTGGPAQTIVDLLPTPSGDGYWLLGQGGGVYHYGDARWFGSLTGTIGGRRTTAFS